MMSGLVSKIKVACIYIDRNFIIPRHPHSPPAYGTFIELGKIRSITRIRCLSSIILFDYRPKGSLVGLDR